MRNSNQALVHFRLESIPQAPFDLPILTSVGNVSRAALFKEAPVGCCGNDCTVVVAPLLFSLEPNFNPPKTLERATGTWGRAARETVTAGVEVASASRLDAVFSCTSRPRFTRTSVVLCLSLPVAAAVVAAVGVANWKGSGPDDAGIGRPSDLISRVWQAGAGRGSSWLFSLLSYRRACVGGMVQRGRLK